MAAFMEESGIEARNAHARQGEPSAITFQDHQLRSRPFSTSPNIEPSNMQSVIEAKEKGLNMYEQLREHLNTRKQDLKGYWILDGSAYEEDICDILKMQCRKSRYWDAEWGGLFLEFEKGRNISLDLVRYSEAVLKLDPDASVSTLTAFFVPTQRREKIEEIIVVDTKALIKKLDLTEDIARGLVALSKRIQRQLNAQASLSLKDVREISLWTV
jgi:hypothetical protein